MNGQMNNYKEQEPIELKDVKKKFNIRKAWNYAKRNDINVCDIPEKIMESFMIYK